MNEYEEQISLTETLSPALLLFGLWLLLQVLLTGILFITGWRITSSFHLFLHIFFRGILKWMNLYHFDTQSLILANLTERARQN